MLRSTVWFITAVGVFLLLIPVGSLFGSDVSGNLALSKGEVVALERAIDTNCVGQPEPESNTMRTDFIVVEDKDRFDELSTQLRDLQSMLDQGIISQEEFTTLKEELLKEF